MAPDFRIKTENNCTVAAMPLGCHTSAPKMTKLICFALKEEAAPFRKIAVRHPGVITLLVGIGRANAEKSVRHFLGSGSAPPELVLTCGFAGGLNPDLKSGDVVFEVQSPESKVQSRLLAAGARPVKFFCADRIATTVAEKKQLRGQTGADAVEMESAAIQAVCIERGIPCATVRVISDMANEDLPLDFNKLAKPDMNLHFGKLFLAIAKSPKKIPALMELQKKTQFAAEQLAAVLGKVI
jgi:nucleoside phosphorylase